MGTEIVTNDVELLSTTEWWASRRRRYNVALLLAGLGAFACLCVVAEVWCQSDVDVEITIFTILFQAVGYCVMMLAANVGYNVGAWGERWLRPPDVAGYRRRVFGALLWGSVALPFTVPLFMAIRCVSSQSTQAE